MDKVFVVCLQVNDDEIILVGAYEDNARAVSVAGDIEFTTRYEKPNADVTAWVEPVPFYGRKEQ